MGTSATVAFMLMDCVVLSARFTPSSTDHTQMLHACVNAYRGQFEHFLLKLIISCLVLLVFLTLFLFNFPSFMLNNCLYCVGCMVCYNVEELRSSYDAKLQHVFFSDFLPVYFCKICQNWAWKWKKKFVEIKPASDTHVDLLTSVVVPSVVGSCYQRFLNRCHKYVFDKHYVY